jgi:hypothetical protein
MTLYHLLAVENKSMERLGLLPTCLIGLAEPLRIMYPPHLDNVIFHQFRQHPRIQEWPMDRLWMPLSRCVSNKYAESNVGVTNGAGIQAHV